MQAHAPDNRPLALGMLVVAGVTAAVIIPAGIGWLTRFGDIDWQRLAARLQGDDEHARDSEPLSPLATHRPLGRGTR